MRTSRNLALLFYITTLLFISCENKSAFNSEFDKSLDTWKSSKKSNGNSYSYTVSFGSVFGFGSETTILVDNDVVIGRTYEAYQLNGNEKVIVEGWVENENELGSHEVGADTITLDQIYNACENDILTVSEDDNFITFLTENDGIISTCSYFPKNCQDDCSVGYNISSIVWVD